MFKKTIEARVLSRTRLAVREHLLRYKVFQKTRDKIKYFEEYNKKYL